MGILFAISLLALAALLWASLSIARHIRHERHGHASAAFGDSAVTNVEATSADATFPADELTFSELSPYGPTVVSRTRIEHAPPPPIPSHAEPPPFPSESVPAPSAAQDWDWTTPKHIVQEASPLPPAANPIEPEIPPPSVVNPVIEAAPAQIASYEPTLTVDPLASSPEQEAPAAALPMETLPSVKAAEEREAHAEAEAHAAIQAQLQAELATDYRAHGHQATSHEATSDELHGEKAQANFDPLPARFAPPNHTPLTSISGSPVPAPDSSAEPSLPRATPTLLSMPPRPPSAPLAAPLKNRLDWTYFNKDMGDLSDPLPSHSRLRHRRH